MINLNKILIFVSLFSISITHADSPLTSVEFWRSSKHKYVLKIGEKSGKQKLNQSMFKFLIDSKINTFEKYCLINSMGWEYNSKVKNHLLFLKYIKKTLIRKNGDSLNDFDIEHPFPFLLKLGETYFMIYEYLKAMDNYIDVTEVKNEILLNTSITLNPQNHFIYNLIDLQDKLLNSDFCSVFETFNLYISFKCIKEDSIKKSLEMLTEYITEYSIYCDTNKIYLGSLCNVDFFTIGINENLQIINYPLFVYGTIKIYNDNQLIFKEYCDGDDLFFIPPAALQCGYNKIVLTDANKTSYSLIINVIGSD